MTQHGAVFRRSKVTCKGEWKLYIKEGAANKKITISASCAGIFRDVSSSVVTHRTGNTSTLMDYHCAFGFTYSGEIFTREEKIRYTESSSCKMSEFYRALTNKEKASGNFSACALSRLSIMFSLVLLGLSNTLA